MKNNLPSQVLSRRGMSLLELTIVILILLSMLGALAVGGRTWKRGGDRAACLMNLRNVQMALRCYQNLYGYEFGGQPEPLNGTRDISDHLLEKG